MEVLILVVVAVAIMLLFRRYLVRDRRRQARSFHPSRRTANRIVPAANSGWFIVALIIVALIIVLVVFT